MKYLLVSIRIRANIDPEKSLWEVVSDGLDYIQVGNVEMPSRAYVSAFGFKGPDQQKKAGVLSGGERNRLNLALTLKQGGNLLLLDEPTNHLDAESVDWLEQFLQKFTGTVVAVTPRPLLPGQRCRMDPGTGPGQRHSLARQLQLVAGPEEQPPEAGRSG